MKVLVLRRSLREKVEWERWLRGMVHVFKILRTRV